MTSSREEDDGFAPVQALVPHLRAFALSLTRNMDLADDLVQETLIKAWQHRERIARIEHLKAWLFTILRNSYFSLARKRRHEFDGGSGLLPESASVSESQSAHMDLIDFERAFSRLHPEHREALVLIGAEGFSYEDAAVLCGCAVGTMKSRVSRARMKLAELLDLHEKTPRPVVVGTEHSEKQKGVS